jgi:NAD(P)-dependent dehydrogenase (short-subunit alcohol dehydrogenase family)
VPFPDGAVYGASKAAVLSLTQSAAVASAEHNVRVFAVCPWITDTPMVDRLTGHQLEAKRQFGAINPAAPSSRRPKSPRCVVRLFTRAKRWTTAAPSWSTAADHHMAPIRRDPASSTRYALHHPADRGSCVPSRPPRSPAAGVPIR